MNLYKYLSLFSISTLSTFIILITGQESKSFSIVPLQPGATQLYETQSKPFLLDDFYGQTFVTPIAEIERGGTFAFQRLLSIWSVISQPISSPVVNWEFETAENDLQGSFEIEIYKPCGWRDDCSGTRLNLSPMNSQFRGVGGQLQLEYKPNISDPQIGQGNLHWIQMVQANYGDGRFLFIHGYPVLDNGKNLLSPFYDNPTLNIANETFFVDRSYAAGRNNAKRNTYFQAQLHLVEEVTTRGSQTRKVKIHNGIHWGWQNKVSKRRRPRPQPVDVPDRPPIIPPIPGWNPWREPARCLGSSGGGGCRQDNPIVARNIDNDWKLFQDVESDLWYDPETPYGFEFQALGDTLFTDILDLPIDIDEDSLFTVSVGDVSLGKFAAGERINFAALFGEGVSNFKITGIDSLFGAETTPFPIRLSFNDSIGSFQMRPFSKSVPEPATIFGLLALTILGWLGIKQDS